MRLHIALAVLAVCCSLALGQTTFADFVIIDDFNVGNVNICSYDSESGETLPKTCTATYDFNASGNRIIGQQRDDQITITSGPEGNVVFSTLVVGGNFSCGTVAQSAGFAELQYDGVDNSMNFNVNGLGVRDLTAGGNAVFFRTIVASDIETVMLVRVYSGASVGGGLSDYCAYNYTIAGGGSFVEYLTPFGDFTPFGVGCDFSRIGAVNVIIEMKNSADPIISFLTTYGPVPSKTPSISVTPSSSSTPTPSISITSTRTPSVSETQTISETPSPSITPTRTASPSASISETPTPSISVTPTSSASQTHSESISESITPTITPTPSISESITPTTSVSESITPTRTESPSVTLSISPSKSISSSKSESATVSETPSISTTPTKSVTPSLSRSPSVSLTPTISETKSTTPTITISVSQTRTPTITGSISKTGSWSRTRTTSISRSLIITPTPSVTRTLTPTISVTKSPSRSAGASRTPTKTYTKTPSPSVGYQYPTYEVFCGGTISIQEAFDQAWQKKAPNGGCYHLATYKDEFEFSRLTQTMIDAGVSEAIIGARRDPVSSDQSYEWGAGQMRGLNFVSTPVKNSADNTFVGTRNCYQASGFCLRVMANVDPVTDSASQIGLTMRLVTDDQQTQVAYLTPVSESTCAVYAYETFSYIPNSRGGTPYIFYAGLDTFDNHQSAAINNRQYLARVVDEIQNQWIIDELQCDVFNVWLGYETANYPVNPTSKALRLSAGSGDGTEILTNGATTCNLGVYCNFPSGWSGVSAIDSAVSLFSTSGEWSVVPQSSLRSALRGKDICNAGTGKVDVCVPNQYGMSWHQTPTTAQAITLIAQGGFYAGGPYTKNIGGVNTLFYFDCMCETYSRVNLDCLAADDPTQCTLYF